MVDAGDERVLAHRCDWQDGVFLAVHNLSGDEVEVRLQVENPEELEQLTDEFGNEPFDPLDGKDPRFRLPPYAYRWLRARRAGSDLPV